MPCAFGALGRLAIRQIAIRNLRLKDYNPATVTGSERSDRPQEFRSTAAVAILPHCRANLVSDARAKLPGEVDLIEPP